MSAPLALDAEVASVLFLIGIHIVALAWFAGDLVRNFNRPDDDRPDDDDGGGFEPPAPSPPPPPGGDGLRPPLPDAVPSRVRLRGPGRLGEALPSPARRPAHPAPVPARTPGRERTTR